MQKLLLLTFELDWNAVLSVPLLIISLEKFFQEGIYFVSYIFEIFASTYIPLIHV